MKDRITDNDKKAIVDLLNETIRIEYHFIVNYPRLIDQLANIDGIPRESIPQSFEKLGKVSAKHFGLLWELIKKLGGEQQLRVGAIEKIVDSTTFLALQAERAKLALSLLQQAKTIAEHSQVKGLRRIWGKANATGEPKRSTILGILDAIIKDKNQHITQLKDAVSALNIQKEKLF